MATPTHHPQAKSTPRASSATAVFTPTASSPPRSVNSPAGAAPSSKVHKSPHKPGTINASTGASSHLGLNAGGHNTVHTPTPLGTAGTPIGAAGTPLAAVATPFGAGIASSPHVGPDGLAANGRGRGSTFGGKSEANTPALSGLAGLGLVPLHNAMVDQMEEGRSRTAEQWTQRIRDIADLLASRWGRVSQESLVACIPRLGLDGIWEDGLGNADVRPGKSRNYMVAGKSFSVEIEWLEGRVKAIVLDLPNAREAAKRTLGRAAEILRRDLVGWNDEVRTGEYVDLQGFALNLQRLARTDQLGMDKASCFEALEGLFVSFMRIWDWEQSQGKADPTNLRAKKAVELQTLCEQTGRPTMHANRRIGLKLDYWLDRRRAYLSEYTKPQSSPGAAEEHWGEHDELWSLLIECQACNPTQYPPIRISDNWVADPISTGADMATAGLAGTINWMDPPALMIPTGDAQASDPDLMDIDVAIRQATNSAPPAVRFIARLEPPVTMAYSTAAQIFELVGQPLGLEPLTPYLAVLFPEQWKQRHRSGGQRSEDHALCFHRTIYSFSETGAPIPHRVMYKVLTSEPLPGRTLAEIPFSHPSQLLTILPVLRQWAHLGKVLRRTVGLFDEEELDTAEDYDLSIPPALHDPSTRKRPASPPSDTDSSSESSSGHSSDSDSDESSGAKASHPHSAARIRAQRRKPPPTVIDAETGTIDLILSTSLTTGRLDLDIAPFSVSGQRATVQFMVNGQVSVSLDDTEDVSEDDNTLVGTNALEDLQMQREAQRALGICEDLGVLRAWMDAEKTSDGDGLAGGRSSRAAEQVRPEGAEAMDVDVDVDIDNDKTVSPGHDHTRSNNPTRDAMDSTSPQAANSEDGPSTTAAAESGKTARDEGADGAPQRPLSGDNDSKDDVMGGPIGDGS